MPQRRQLQCSQTIHLGCWISSATRATHQSRIWVSDMQLVSTPLARPTMGRSAGFPRPKVLVEVGVRGESQELDEFVPVRERDLLEERAGLVVAIAELRHLLFDRSRDLVVRDAAVAEPLPDLRAGDLRGRRVLHE